jgi:Amt family ammonium transporter
MQRVEYNGENTMLCFKTKFTIVAHFGFLFGLFFLSPIEVLAAEKLSEGNTAWVMTATTLVLFMTMPGLSLF